MSIRGKDELPLDVDAEGVVEGDWVALGEAEAVEDGEGVG
jgi:hypothetical protein